jgi:UDP-3-O-[3-hydroxymyristoyl] glucosamine N-acyltransferase
MSEPVFLKHTRGLTLAEIASLTGAAAPAMSADRRIVDVASLERAGPSDLTFFDDARLASTAVTTHAGACLTTAALAGQLPASVIKLVVQEPYRSFVAVARSLFPQALRPSSLYEAGVAGTHIDATARLEQGVMVEPGAVIGPQAEIGAGTVIGANAVVGAEVRIGRDCAIGAGACIANALIGDRVTVHPGCMIGQGAAGFVTDGGRRLKVPQVGRVIIQDEVEVGAGSTIDRGDVGDTVVGEGTKIDNLVQVGHNASIGRHCMLMAQSGVAGGAVVDDFIVLGTQLAPGETVARGP